MDRGRLDLAIAILSRAHVPPQTPGPAAAAIAGVICPAYANTRRPGRSDWDLFVGRADDVGTMYVTQTRPFFGPHAIYDPVIHRRAFVHPSAVALDADPAAQPLIDALCGAPFEPVSVLRNATYEDWRAVRDLVDPTWVSRYAVGALLTASARSCLASRLLPSDERPPADILYPVSAAYVGRAGARSVYVASNAIAYTTSDVGVQICDSAALRLGFTAHDEPGDQAAVAVSTILQCAMWAEVDAIAIPHRHPVVVRAPELWGRNVRIPHARLHGDPHDNLYLVRGSVWRLMRSGRGWTSEIEAVGPEGRVVLPPHPHAPRAARATPRPDANLSEGEIVVTSDDDVESIESMAWPDDWVRGPDGRPVARSPPPDVVGTPSIAYATRTPRSVRVVTYAADNAHEPITTYMEEG